MPTNTNIKYTPYEGKTYKIELVAERINTLLKVLDATGGDKTLEELNAIIETIKDWDDSDDSLGVKEQLINIYNSMLSEDEFNKLYLPEIDKDIANVDGRVDALLQKTHSIKSGNGDNSLILNDLDNNQTIAEHSIAMGLNTKSGHKAFAFAPHDYSEADYTDKENNIGKYYLNTTNGIVTDINYSMVLENNYTYQGKVISIGDNYIEVNNYLLPNSDAVTMLSEKSYIIFPDNPEIQGDKIIGIAAHSEGFNTNAMATYSHAEGGDTKSSAKYSHSEGRESVAGGYASHAEGDGNKANGNASHSEGKNNTSHGHCSHSEGEGTEAGTRCHAEGLNTKAQGYISHTEGIGTVANGDYQHVQGKYNKPDITSAHIVGNGKDANNLSNAHTLDWGGNAWFAGDVKAGNISLQTLNEKVTNIEIDIETALDSIIAIQSSLIGGGSV